MDNAKILAFLRRLSVLVMVPAISFGFAFLLVLLPFTWVITGKDMEEQTTWAEDKAERYWDWVKR